MKKKVRRLALLVAAVACLTAIPQNAMQVEAASERAFLCGTCGSPATVTTIQTNSIKRLIRTGDCQDRTHTSLGCYMCTVVYKGDVYVYCPKCNVTAGPNDGECPVFDQHSALVKQ